MAFQPVPNTWEIAVHGVNPPAAPWVNIFHLLWASGYVQPTQLAADGVAEAIQDAWQDSNLVTNLTAGTAMVDVQVTGLNASTDSQFVSSSSVWNGTSGAQSLPGQVQGIVDWRTDLRGRNWRGRTFLTGFAEDASDGHPSVTAVANMNGWAALMISGFHNIFGGSNDLCVVSRFSKTDVPMAPHKRAVALTRVISVGEASQEFATIRRRRFGLA